MSWHNESGVESESFVCGYCGFNVASAKGWHHQTKSDWRIRACPHCDKPSFFEGKLKRFPSARFGSEVQHLPENVHALFTEARDCMSVDACTAATMCCRTLLMHIAVDLKAPAGKDFSFYVNYLADNGHIPVGGKVWVDVIRKKGNLANHEVTIIARPDAEQILHFTEWLLKMTYEFPEKAPKS